MTSRRKLALSPSTSTLRIMFLVSLKHLKWCHLLLLLLKWS